MLSKATTDIQDEDVPRRESASIHSVKMDADEATERTEFSVNSRSSKDSGAQRQISCNAYSCIQSDSPSEIKYLKDPDEAEQHRSSVASDDLTLGNQSYIMDLTSQKQQRERDRHEEAFEETLERMKVTNLDPDSDEYALKFLSMLTKVKGEIKEKYKAHDRLQDQRLEEAMKDTENALAKFHDDPTPRPVSLENGELAIDNDTTPERPQRKKSSTPTYRYPKTKQDNRGNTPQKMPASKDSLPTKPARVESQSCPRLVASVSESSKDLSPTKPLRVESQSCPRLLASVSKSSKDTTPTKPARIESQPLARLLASVSESSNDMTPSKPSRVESELASVTDCEKECRSYMTPSRKPLRMASEPVLRPETLHQVSCLKIQCCYRRHLARKCLQHLKKIVRKDPALVQRQEDTKVSTPQSEGSYGPENGPSHSSSPCTRIPLKTKETPLRYISLEIPSDSPSAPSSGIKQRDKANVNGRRIEQKRVQIGCENENLQSKGDDDEIPSARSQKAFEVFQSKQYKDIDFIAPLQQSNGTKEACYPFHAPKNEHDEMQGRPYSYGNDTVTKPSESSSAAPKTGPSIPKKHNVSSILQSASTTCKKAVPKMMPLGVRSRQGNKGPLTTPSQSRKRGVSQERKRISGVNKSENSVQQKERVRSGQSSRSKSNERTRPTARSRSKNKEMTSSVARSRSKSTERSMRIEITRSKSQEKITNHVRSRSKSSERPKKNEMQRRTRSKSKEGTYRQSQASQRERGSAPKPPNKKIVVKLVVRKNN